MITFKVAPCSAVPNAIPCFTCFPVEELATVLLAIEAVWLVLLPIPAAEDPQQNKSFSVSQHFTSCHLGIHEAEHTIKSTINNKVERNSQLPPRFHKQPDMTMILNMVT